jgi:cytidylate kinase
MAYAFGAPDSPYAPPPVTVDDKDLFDVQKTIIQEASERGPATIVGRGGFALLKGLPGHLSVFLHAPLDLRARRIRRLYSLGSLEEARDMAEQSDRERGHFVKAVVGANWLDPNQYHICLDTGRLGTGAATELLYQAALEVARSVRNKEEPELL